MGKRTFLILGCMLWIAAGLFWAVESGNAQPGPKPEIKPQAQTQGKRNASAAIERLNKRKELVRLRMEAAKRSRAARAALAAKGISQNNPAGTAEGGKK